MKKELQEILFKAHPQMFREAKLSESESTMGRGITTDNGWFDLLWHLCAEIQLILNKDKKLAKKFAITQVKEKLGFLRMYTRDSSDEINNLINVAVRESSRTCEVCGRKGKLIEDEGWLSVRCKECKEKGI